MQSHMHTHARTHAHTHSQSYEQRQTQADTAAVEIDFLKFQCCVYFVSWLRLFVMYAWFHVCIKLLII